MIYLPKELCVAGRALLNWTREDLAAHSGVSIGTIGNIEAGKRYPVQATIRAVVGAFAAAGVTFRHSTGEFVVSRTIEQEKASQEYVVYVEGVFPPMRCAVGSEVSALRCAEHIRKMFPHIRDYVNVVPSTHWQLQESEPVSGHLKDGVNAFINTGNGDKRPEKGTLTICA